MKAIFVVGDIGSTKDLIPAARELARLDHKVTWFADPLGKGKELLTNEEIPFHERSSASQGSNYDVFVIGTSATAVNHQIVWTTEGKESGKTVIWFEDLWGTGQRPATLGVNPSVMLTISETASRIVKSVRPNIQVEVVGKPSFEELASFDPDKIKECREQIRKELGVKDDDVVILYWGGGEQNRVKLHLEALMQIKTVDSRRVIHLPRLHPKMPERDEVWSHLQTLPHVLDVHDVNEVALNCAADVAMGEFGSTQTYVAAMMGTLPLIALWPDNLEERKACGFVDGKPPQIKHKIASSVRSCEKIKEDLLLWVGHDDREFLRQKALRVFGDAIKPGAAKRIADAIVKYAK